MEVMRGQIFNLREALRNGKSPLQLVQMPPQLLVEVRKPENSLSSFLGPAAGRINRAFSRRTRTVSVEEGVDAIDGTQTNNASSSANGARGGVAPATKLEWHDAFQQKVQTRGPFFQWC